MYQRYNDIAMNDDNGLYGLFLTEFGACSDSDTCIKTLQRILTMMNNSPYNGGSWTYWSFKYFNDITTLSGHIESFYYQNGTLQANKVETLSIPYPSIVAGKLVVTDLEGYNDSSAYDFETNTFRMSYIALFLAPQCTVINLGYNHFVHLTLSQINIQVVQSNISSSVLMKIVAIDKINNQIQICIEKQFTYLLNQMLTIYIS